MTREEIKRNLEEALTRHGFPFTYTRYDWMPMVPQSNNDYAGITFMSIMDFCQETGMLTELITCQARVCHMNPTATARELMDAADQITRAATLMNEVNAMALILHTGIMKEAE